MICKKCARQLPEDAIYCCYCGIKQVSTPTRKKRANGSGTAYRTGATWTAKIVLDYAPSAGASGCPSARTLRKAGFATKSKALDFVPVLKAAASIPDDSRRQVIDTAARLGTIPEAVAYVHSWQRTAPTRVLSFRALYDKWYDFYAPRIDASTLSGHRAALAYYKDLWDYPITELTADDLQECIDSCPRGRRTQENLKQLAKRLYEYAIGRLLVSVNCAEYLYIPKSDGKPRAALTQAHVDAIASQIGRYPYADYVYCLAYLGFRPNEMLQLKKDALHYEHGVYYLIGGFKTAAGTDRVVTISPRILPIIQRLHKAPGDYLFPGPDGRPMTDAYLRTSVFYPLLSRLGIQPVPQEGEHAEYVPYSCRHFFANLLKSAAGAEKDKAALIGHSDYETTVRVYQSSDLLAMRSITDGF